MSNKLNVKIATAVMREFPKVRRERDELKVKVASLLREKRINEIEKTAAQKQVTIADDLTKCSDERLSQIESGLQLVSPSGGFTLGSQETGDEEGNEKTAKDRSGQDLDDISRFLLDPEAFTLGEAED